MDGQFCRRPSDLPLCAFELFLPPPPLLLSQEIPKTVCDPGCSITDGLTTLSPSIELDSPPPMEPRLTLFGRRGLSSFFLEADLSVPPTCCEGEIRGSL